MKDEIEGLSEEETKRYLSEQIAKGLREFLEQPSSPDVRKRMKERILQATDEALKSLGTKDEWTKVTGCAEVGKGLYTIGIETRDPRVIIALYESDPDGTIYGVTREQYDEARACIRIEVTLTVDTSLLDKEDHCSCCDHCYPDQCVGKCALRDCDLDEDPE